MPNDTGYLGTYTADNGRFWLQFTDHVVERHWVEEMASERCNQEYMGSNYWGRLQLANSAGWPGFEMLGGYCFEGRIDKVWTFRESLPDGL